MLLYYATKDMMSSRTEKSNSRKKLLGKKTVEKKTREPIFSKKVMILGATFISFQKNPAFYSNKSSDITESNQNM